MMGKMKKYISVLLLVVLNCISSNAISAQMQIVQDDPLLIIRTLSLPSIDGVGDDPCWVAANWQSIGKVWIPFNGFVPDSDYAGRYKVMWSSETNLLYFLIVIYDDVYVDGYVPSPYGGCYNYDITEVFIDENHSGGEHRYDGSATNAENAFAYHMYADYPDEGEVNSIPYIEDMIGTQSSSTWVDHAFHFPEYALKKTGNMAVREFSLIVYNDTYTEENTEAAIADLHDGKVMGLSVAYCDNDHPEKSPRERDNMYGSVVEPSPGNLHWMNADYFGTVKLVDELSTGMSTSLTTPKKYVLHQNYPNPFNPSTVIEYQLAENAFVTLKIYDILGNEIKTLVNEFQNKGNYTVRFNASSVRQQTPSGVYLYRLDAGQYHDSRKFVLLK